MTIPGQACGPVPEGRPVLRAPRPPARSALVSRPGAVTTVLLALLVFVPLSRVPGKVGWGLLGVAVLLVTHAVLRHAGRLRWTAPPVLLLLMGATALLSTSRHGSLGDLLEGVGITLLLAGCSLLAVQFDRSDTDLIVTAVIALALVQLLFATASAFLGVPAPWGYLGQTGALFGSNELLPALGGRATGTMAHPIPFGTLMAAAACLALFRDRRWGPVVRLVAAGACSFGVLLSGSRSAVACLAVGVLLGLLLPGTARIGPLARSLALGTVAGALLLMDLRDLSLVRSLEGTGSLTHRLGALESVGRLFDRPLLETLAGSGHGSLPVLFAEGFLQQDGFFAVDNQFVTTFALSGLIGVAALLAVALVGLVRGDRASRPAAAVVLLMFLSFDALQWPAIAVLFAVLVPLGADGPRRRGSDLGSLEQPGVGVEPAVSGRQVREHGRR